MRKILVGTFYNQIIYIEVTEEAFKDKELE